MLNVILIVGLWFILIVGLYSIIDYVFKRMPAIALAMSKVLSYIWARAARPLMGPIQSGRWNRSPHTNDPKKRPLAHCHIGNCDKYATDGRMCAGHAFLDDSVSFGVLSCKIPGCNVVQDGSGYCGYHNGHPENQFREGKAVGEVL